MLSIVPTGILVAALAGLELGLLLGGWEPWEVLVAKLLELLGG